MQNEIEKLARETNKSKRKRKIESFDDVGVEAVNVIKSEVPGIAPAAAQISATGSGVPDINNLFDDPGVPSIPESPKEEKPGTPMTEAELLERLQQIDRDTGLRSFGSYEGQELNLERKQAGEWDEERAREIAENKFGQTAITERQNIEDNAVAEARALERTKASVTEQNEHNKQTLTDLFSARKDAASADAVNRGLARSSIIINQIEAFDKGKIEEINKLNIELSRAFAEIEGSLHMLEAQKESALRNFDLSHAVRINQKIDELEKEHARKVEEVLRYNNEIERIEAEFRAREQERALNHDRTVIDINTKYWDAVQRFGRNTVEAQMQERKFELTREYFLSMDPNAAFRQLAGSNFWVQQLGLQNLQRLLDEINRKR